MRAFSKVSGRFWIGDTGRNLRAMGRDCQVVALYLLTAPGSNMIGLYYLPIPVLAHETGLTLEGASKALRRVCDGVFAHYDEDAETVWVVNMARDQIGEALHPSDKQVKGVIRDLEERRSSSLAQLFYDHYREAFNLPPCKALRSPLQGPSKPLRSQETETETEQETETEKKASRACARDPSDPLALAPPAPTTRKRQSKQQQSSQPMPFAIEEAQAALSTAAPSRFALGRLDPGIAVRVTAMIRAIPDVDDWRTAAAYLAAGGYAYLCEPLGWRWIATGQNMADLVAVAKQWDAAGRGSPLAGGNGKPRSNDPALLQHPEDAKLLREVLG